MGTSNAMAVVDDDGVVYIGGGWTSDPNNLTAISTYDPLTCHWSALPSCPVQYGRLATIGKEKTVVGGILEEDWKTTDKLFTWERAGKWKEQYPCMSVPRLTPAVSVYDNKYLIVAGGLSRDCGLDSIEVLELEKKEWSQSVVKLPYTMTEAVGSIAGDDFIIMGNHSDEDNADSSTCSVLSIPISAILGKTPVTITTLPPPPIPNSTLLQNVNPPLLLGGCSDTDELPGVFVYSNELNNWKKVGSTSYNRANAMAIALKCDTILLLGGVNKPDYLSKDTIVSSVETGCLVSGLMSCY